MYGSWDDPMSTTESEPSQLVEFFQPFVQKCCVELENTFKKFIENIEALHRTATLGSTAKLLDMDARNLISRFQSELRKDKENPNTDMLEEIRNAAFSRAQKLWNTDFWETITIPLTQYLETAFGIQLDSSKTYPEAFDLSKLPMSKIVPYKTVLLASQRNKKRDSSEKSKIISSEIAEFTSMRTLKWWCSDDCMKHLRTRVFLKPIPCDDIEDFVDTVWRHIYHPNKNRSVWIGRVVMANHKNYLQCGHLSYDFEKGYMELKWMQTLEGDHEVPDVTQIELVPFPNEGPHYDDSQLSYPSYIFSESLWSSGKLRMLPIPTEIIKKATKGKQSLQATDDSLTTEETKQPQTEETKQPQKETNKKNSKAVDGLKRTESLQPKSAESLQPKSAKRQVELPVENTPNGTKRGLKKDDAAAKRVAKRIKASVPVPTTWKYARCIYKVKRGPLCENEAMWCESESASKPQYCNAHKLESSSFYFYSLRGRKFPPGTDETSEEEADANVTGDSSECSDS